MNNYIPPSQARRNWLLISLTFVFFFILIEIVLIKLFWSDDYGLLGSHINFLLSSLKAFIFNFSSVMFTEYVFTLEDLKLKEKLKLFAVTTVSLSLIFSALISWFLVWRKSAKIVDIKVMGGEIVKS
ncbi:hypothetical protein [Litorilituus lipolyticus]|uniref:Uncharacterized protein n=1 Tax=Litorilituus lipolyticus TaxID=2491017 RepID=A0A502KSF9_9GAMM|nr:hypothetical protein [Litorilituus lipolyticus]TPH13259.1 hypothetical protein EPA86_13780 [Litorilituus lipolyticus]